MNTLYELDNNFNAVLSMVYDEDVDLDMLEDTLQAIEAALETKVQNGIGLFRELEKERNGLKAEIERLTKKLKRIDGSIERLKTYYQAHLESMAKDAVKTPIGTMKIC
ncbi:conserved hypothetical protein [Thermosinus carboxydivorans Nor1]|uniref:Uncharacterized protein n=1 Tax=Thermosinus carboxydivorans Nor1 TaxID=401526 RepID=A1HR35_9FIRM|nr:siphovirus Gp157 family protein [Thermosinus carboxydivorans]EAX47538.1 conserved hypothetical protein [Thermosinus carboxydivorans Nor1]